MTIIAEKNDLSIIVLKTFCGLTQFIDVMIGQSDWNFKLFLGITFISSSFFIDRSRYKMTYKSIVEPHTTSIFLSFLSQCMHQILFVLFLYSNMLLWEFSPSPTFSFFIMIYGPKNLEYII